jgi:hypothetical protein
VRLRGAAVETHDCSYSATFIDGTSAGPVPAGEACESESLAPMESFRIEVVARGEEPAAGSGSAVVRAASAAAAKPPGAKPTPKPKAPVGRVLAARPRRRT